MEDHGPQALTAGGGTMRSGPEPAARAVVLVAPGGTSGSTKPTSATQLAVLRMLPVAQAIRQAVRGRQVEVRRPRFTVRGWNDGQASPVADLERLLDGLAETAGQV